MVDVIVVEGGFCWLCLLSWLFLLCWLFLLMHHRISVIGGVGGSQKGLSSVPLVTMVPMDKVSVLEGFVSGEIRGCHTRVY